MTPSSARLITDRPVPRGARGRLRWPDHIGFSPDLNAAMGDAIDAMLTWLQASYGVGKATALACQPGARPEVTQVATSHGGVLLRDSGQARSAEGGVVRERKTASSVERAVWQGDKRAS